MWSLYHWRRPSQIHLWFYMGLFPHCGVFYTPLFLILKRAHSFLSAFFLILYTQPQKSSTHEWWFLFIPLSVYFLVCCKEQHSSKSSINTNNTNDLAHFYVLFAGMMRSKVLSSWQLTLDVLMNSIQCIFRNYRTTVVWNLFLLLSRVNIRIIDA